MQIEDLGLKQTSDFRRFLQSELIRRCEKNANYSLRAFASSLGVSHATLSSILSGKRPLTTKAIVKLGGALNLSEKDIFRLSVQNAEKQNKKTKVQEHQLLTLDVFTAISDWYHDAILELTHTKNFKPNIKWIAKRLGLSNVEVQAAKERLERLELLEVINDKWIDCSKNNTTNINNDLSSAALRKLQEKILHLSAQALRAMPRNERDHTSLTVAMAKSDLEEVKERIKQFRFELVSYIERKQIEPDEVYQFAFSVFPLTKDKINKEFDSEK